MSMYSQVQQLHWYPVDKFMPVLSHDFEDSKQLFIRLPFTIMIGYFRKDFKGELMFWATDERVFTVPALVANGAMWAFCSEGDEDGTGFSGL